MVINDFWKFIAINDIENGQNVIGRCWREEYGVIYRGDWGMKGWGPGEISCVIARGKPQLDKFHYLTG